MRLRWLLCSPWVPEIDPWFHSSLNEQFKRKRHGTSRKVHGLFLVCWLRFYMVSCLSLGLPGIHRACQKCRQSDENHWKLFRSVRSMRSNWCDGAQLRCLLDFERPRAQMQLHAVTKCTVNKWTGMEISQAWLITSFRAQLKWALMQCIRSEWKTVNWTHSVMLSRCV